MLPQISIVLPVYNAEQTLASCLQSISRQTETRFECLIVDDGSSDQSALIAKKHVLADKRFRLIQREHQGLVPTLNHAIGHCRAPYIARMDADDLMRKVRLFEQVRALEEHPQWSAVGTHVRFFPRSQISDGLIRYERWLNAIRTPRDVEREAFIECPIAHPSLMIRTAVLQKLAYRDRAWPEDYDLVLRLLANGHQISVVTKRLLLWRDGPNRLSRTAASYSLQRFTACRAAFLAESFLSDHEEYILWGYGSTGRTLGKALASHGKRPSAIVELHPGRIGQTIAGATVIPPAMLAARRGSPIIISVAGEVARRQIRASLHEMGFAECRDYRCCA